MSMQNSVTIMAVNNEIRNTQYSSDALTEYPHGLYVCFRAEIRKKSCAPHFSLCNTRHCTALLMCKINPFHIVISLTVHSSIEKLMKYIYNQTMGQVADLIYS